MTKRPSIPLADFLRDFDDSTTTQPSSPLPTIEDEKSLLAKIGMLCSSIRSHKGSFVLNESVYSEAISSSYSIFFYSAEYKNPDLLLFDPIVDIKYNAELNQYKIFSYPDACTILTLKDFNNVQQTSKKEPI